MRLQVLPEPGKEASTAPLAYAFSTAFCPSSTWP